jgi:hypothetical protein
MITARRWTDDRGERTGVADGAPDPARDGARARAALLSEGIANRDAAIIRYIDEGRGGFALVRLQSSRKALAELRELAAEGSDPDVLRYLDHAEALVAAGEARWADAKDRPETYEGGI